MKHLQNYIRITRGIDIRYPSNIFIIVLSSFVFLISFVLGIHFNENIVVSLSFAASNFFFLFLTWAITRELDPDHPGSALVSCILVLPIIFLNQDKLIIPSLMLIICLRVLSKTVGISIRIFDLLYILPIIFYGSIQSGFPLAILGLILFLIYFFIEKTERKLSILGFVFCIFVFIVSLVWGRELNIVIPSILVSLIGILSIPIFTFASRIILKKLKSKDDLNINSLSQSRILSTHLFMILVSLLFCFFEEYQVSALENFFIILSISFWVIILRFYRRIETQDR